MSTRVHQALAASTNIVFPGVYDTLSAKMAERVGFQLAFVSGYAVSATLIGEPDFGLLTQSEVIDRARHICRSVSMPVIVDADTGYGNPLNVIRTVQELIDAGAAGCFLEDQQWPKRCGHMRGKKVIPKDEYLNKIHAAVDARQDADFFIVARTDAIASLGVDAAIERAEAARALGADANMIEQGRTPVLPQPELSRLGFQLILYPLTGLYASAKALETTFTHLQVNGTTAGHEDRLISFERFNELIGVEQKYAKADKYTRKED